MLCCALALAGPLVSVAACGDTSDPPRSPAASSTTSSTADGYHGEFGGRGEAGTNGGDANPDAESGG
jgi:hypothetical protein